MAKRKQRQRGAYGEGYIFTRPLNTKGATYYYCIPNPGGNPITRSCGTRDRDEAMAEKRRALDSLARTRKVGKQTPEERSSKITIGELLDGYIALLKTNKDAEETATNTESVIEKHLRVPFGHRLAATLTTADLREYRAQKLASGEVGSGSLDHHMAYLRRAYQIGRLDEKYIAPPPHFPVERKDNARTGWLPPEGYPKILAALAVSLKIIFVFCYHLGIRIGELLQYRWDMIDWKRHVIQVPGRICKNGKDRDVPILDCDVRLFLHEQFRIRETKYPDCPWIFFWHAGRRRGRQILDFRESWEVAAAAAGYPRLMVHDLRRTAAKMLVEEWDLSIEEAILITGHADTGQFKRYLQKVTKKIQSVARQIESKIREQAARA